MPSASRHLCVDGSLLRAYKEAMDYPTVRVRIEGPEIRAEVDIAPKPEPDNLVTVSQDEQAPADPPSTGLPNWMLYAG